MNLKTCFNEALSKNFPHHIAVNGEDISVRIIPGTPRRRRMAIRVTRTGEVDVLVPRQASLADVYRILASRTDWIAEHVQRIRSLPPVLPKAYVAGERHFFRGRPYALQLIPVAGNTPALIQIEQETGLLRIGMVNPSPDRVRKVLLDWYKKAASQFIEERLAVLCPRISWLEGIPSWKVRTMRRRWGSCSRTGELTLNTHLAKVPEFCLDFVLLHEVAHLRELNHSHRFYAVLTTLLPDWKDRKRELDRMSDVFLREDLKNG